MDTRYCIVGHGIAGCTLALTLLRKNIPFVIYGIPQHGEASLASSGLITPVTGRKYVKSWMIDELITFATDFYEWTELLLGRRYFFPVEIVRFLTHPEAVIAWDKRSQDPEYYAYISQKKTEQLDELGKPYGIITGSYRLDTQGWLTDVWEFLKKRELLKEEFFIPPLNDNQWKGIIYATGALPPLMSPGLIPNKGQALVVRMPDWKFDSVIKEDVFFVPLRDGQIYWVGSYYDPWPEHPYPTPEGKLMLSDAIKKVYSGPVEILEHLSGIRPTVNDRRPLVGPWPASTAYLFNGMGTKGTSLAPYWAEMLADHLIKGSALPHFVLPARYTDQQ